MTPASLPIDLADPADVRAKLPRAMAILAEKERELEALQKEIALWRSHVKYLDEIATLTAPKFSVKQMTERIAIGLVAVAAAVTSAAELKSRSDQIVSVVENAGRPIRAKDVHEALVASGFAVDAEVVQNALYYAASTGRLERLVRGTYAPAGYYADHVARSAARAERPAQRAVEAGRASSLKEDARPAPS
jgi:hypothetical protein